MRVKKVSRETKEQKRLWDQHMREEESNKLHRPEKINHPSHYGGDTVYEAIKVIEAWQLGFCLGNTVKYISRAGKKDKNKLVEDLEKARWYLDREIKTLKGESRGKRQKS